MTSFDISNGGAPGLSGRRALQDVRLETQLCVGPFSASHPDGMSIDTVDNFDAVMSGSAASNGVCTGGPNEKPKMT